jgi:hypothetical protein
MVSSSIEHDPEKWVPVFGKDHAPWISQSGMAIRRKAIPLCRTVLRRGVPRNDVPLSLRAERSKAIQDARTAAGLLDCFVATLLAMT